MKKLEINEIMEGHLIVDSPEWTYNDIPVSIHIEILNMDDATGEPEYKDYPFLVSFEIVAANPHESYDETDSDFKPDRISLLYDAISYMGGVPIDHDFYSLDAENKDLMGNLKAKEALLRTHGAKFGTVAAQRGEHYKFTYPQFKDYEAAEKFAKAMIKNYAEELLSDAEELIERPINMMGECGSRIIVSMAEGK